MFYRNDSSCRDDVGNICCGVSPPSGSVVTEGELRCIAVGIKWEAGFFDFEPIKDCPDFSQYRYEVQAPSEDP